MSADMETLWAELANSKQFRAAFVAAHVSQTIPLQVRLMMDEQEINQTELARRAGLDQATISRALDPAYGHLTLTTCVRIAAGLDVAFVGHFVPFSELLEWIDDADDRAISKKFEEDALAQNENQRETADQSLIEVLRASLNKQSDQTIVMSAIDDPVVRFGTFRRFLKMRLDLSVRAQSLIAVPDRINPDDQIEWKEAYGGK